MGRPGEECLPGLSSCLLVDWVLASPGWVVSSAISALCRLLLGSLGTVLVIGVFLAGTPSTAGFMAADPGHVT